MFKFTKVFKYIVFVTILAMLVALLWWYFSLRTQQGALRATEEGRGADAATISFGGVIGSTYSYITSDSITEVSTSSESKVSAQQPPRLWQITKTPIAGVDFIGSATSTVIRFVERGSGYVLEADPRTSALTRLTNTLIPRIYEASLGANGVVLLRSVDESNNVITVVGKIPTTTSGTITEPSALSLAPLPQNIKNVILSSTGDEILYTARGSGGLFVIVRAAWNGSNAKQLAYVGISGLQLNWLRDGRITLLENPGGGTNYAYEVGNNGTLTPIKNGGIDFEVLPKDNSTAVLYSTTKPSLTLSSYIEVGDEISSLPVHTYASKCVWAPDNSLVAYCAVPLTLPSPTAFEERLRGETYTSDAWWKVDARSGQVQILYTPSGAQIDVENPIIDADGKFIAFMNARDKSLWLLRI